MHFDLIHLNPETGELGRTPPNGIVNIAGISGPIFTVHGKALLFADGTLSDGSNGSSVLNVTLQQSYASGGSNINLSAGKDFIINALNGKSFKVDADNGEVNITGNLNVPSINGVPIENLGGSALKKFEFTQTLPTVEWTILHNLNSMHLNITVYDEANEEFLPNLIKLISPNIAKVLVNTAQAGRAILFAA